MTDYFPPSLISPDRLNDVLDWVRLLPFDPQDKKRMLLDWAARVGITLTYFQIREAVPDLSEDER